jgi:hypothetical protein
MTTETIPLAADLWRLLGQRQALNEVAEWHRKEFDRLEGSESILDLCKALWHVHMIEVIYELDQSIRAEIKEKEACSAKVAKT